MVVSLPDPDVRDSARQKVVEVCCFGDQVESLLTILTGTYLTTRNMSCNSKLVSVGYFTWDISWSLNLLVAFFQLQNPSVEKAGSALGILKFNSDPNLHWWQYTFKLSGAMDNSYTIEEVSAVYGYCYLYHKYVQFFVKRLLVDTL